jgi:hypothetical protein
LGDVTPAPAGDLRSLFLCHLQSATHTDVVGGSGLRSSGASGSAELSFNSAACSLAMESIKVSSTRQINTKRKEAGQLWQGRFFDRALRTVKEYGRAIEYMHWNPVKRGLVKRPGEWVWSSYTEYAVPGEDARIGCGYRLMSEHAFEQSKSRRVKKQLCATR